MLEARIYKHGTIGLNGSVYVADQLGSTFDDIYGETLPCNYLTFDGAGVSLDDNNLKFYESGDTAGYTVTDYNGLPFVSDDNCVIQSQNNYNVILLTLDENLQFPKNITIQFNTECCREIELHYVYANTGNVLKVQTLSVTDEFIDINLEPEDCSKIEIYFTKTFVPNQCVRINGIYPDKVKRITEFSEHSLIEEINILSDDLPINQFECSVTDISEIERNTAIELYNNHRYYGKYYVQTVERIAESIYRVTAQNVLCYYDGVPFLDWEHSALRGVTVDSVVFNLETLTNSNITINGTVAEYINGTHIDRNCRATLCELAYTLAKMIDSSRQSNNSIYLKDVPGEITSVITNNDRRILGEATYKKNTEFSNAEITRQDIGTIESEELESETKSVNGNIGDIVVVTVDSPSAFFSATGAIILSHTLTSAYIKLIATSAAIKYAKYPTWNTVTTINNLNTANGQVKSYKNFLTFAENSGGDNRNFFAERQNRNIQKYISSQGTVTAKIRLRNEKVGDLIQIETAWDGIITGIITKMTISFGYEDIADIEVLEWNI